MCLARQLIDPPRPGRPRARGWVREEGSNMATLCDYKTGEAIREATEAEAQASREAAKRDGGAGVILVNGRSCYVED